MKIDTLILGGGGTTGISYIGIFQALFEKNIIQPDLQGITHIIGISAGAMFAIPLLLQMNLSACLSLMEQFNMNELLIIKGKVNTIFLLQLFENLSLIEEDTLSAYTKYNLRRNNK